MIGHIRDAPTFPAGPWKVSIMDVGRHVEGAITYFVVSNLDPRFHATMHHQFFTEQD
jgi:hypothetical protein